MFATVAEAEKAAAMLRRFGGVVGDIYVHPDGLQLNPGPGERYLWDWQDVADYLLAQLCPDLSEDDE
jgi:hypothetical protein